MHMFGCVVLCGYDVESKRKLELKTLDEYMLMCGDV